MRWQPHTLVPPKSEIAEFVLGGARNIEDNPMDQEIERRNENLKRAPRCGALTRTAARCQRPAMRGRKRCRLHGGLSPGAPGFARGGIKNRMNNPMDQDLEIRLKNLKQAPRCGALTRVGAECQRPAIRGRRRCRLHGGLSPGAPRGIKNGNYRNGHWTAEAMEERSWLRSLVQTFAKSGTTE
jgi:hypothetical protein